MNSSNYNFVLTTTKVTKSGRIERDQGCYGFIFWNKGADSVLVDGKLLKPHPVGQPNLSGESWAYVDAEQREYNQSYFTVVFLATTAPYLEITQVIKPIDNG